MDPFVIVGIIAVVILAVTVHESAHAFVADRLGDPTARRLGRITLNPLPHIDPFATILLPGILLLLHSPVIFGGAKPVPVIFGNLRHPWRDMALVALAGPVSNLLQAAFWAGLLSVLLHTGAWQAESAGVRILQWGIKINAILAILNLMPIPPLDGSRVMAYVLPTEARRAYIALEPLGLFIIFGLLMWFRPFGLLLYHGYNSLGNLVADLTQLPILWDPMPFAG